MSLGKRTSLIGASSLVALLAVAGFAWACTVQARILAISSPSGPPGFQATIRGEGLAAGAQVKVVWNGTEGPQLAQALADDSGNFTAEVHIPQVSPGVYYLVAKAENAGLARVPFEVIAPLTVLADSGPTAGLAGHSGSMSPDLWGAFNTSSGPTAPEPSSGADNKAAGLAAGWGLVALSAAAIAGVTPLAIRKRRRAV